MAALAHFLVFVLSAALGTRLDSRPRFRRAGAVYLTGMSRQVVMHAIRGVLE